MPAGGGDRDDAWALVLLGYLLPPGGNITVVTRWLLALVTLVLLVVLALGLFGGSGGGGGGGGGGAAAAPSGLPYPPKAAEPASAPPLERPPAGRVVRIGGPAEGVAADPETGLVAVARKDEPLLMLVDGATGDVSRRVSLPAAARHLEIAEPGGPVLVPAEDADALVEVSLPGGEKQTTPVGDFPHDAAFSAGRAYTADEFGSTVTAVQGGRRVGQAPVDVQPGNIVAVGDELAVISVRAYTLTLLDRRTLRGDGSQFTGSGPTHAAVDADGRIYVTDTRGNALSVFASRPRLKFIARVHLAGGAPLGIEADRRRNRIWVSLTATNQLLEFEASDRPRRLRTLPTVRQPNSLTVDERTGRVIVASASDDALQFIDP